MAATRSGDEIQEGEEGREGGGRTSSPLNKNESQNPEGERLAPERSRAQVSSWRTTTLIMAFVK